MQLIGRKLLGANTLIALGLLLGDYRGKEEHQKCSAWMRRAACQGQWYTTFRSLPTMFKTSKPGLFLGLAALWKRGEPRTALLGFAFSGLGGAGMADGQHISAMNPMGKGVCMHVGNPCSFSVPYFSCQPFPVPIRTWHSLEMKR